MLHFHTGPTCPILTEGEYLWGTHSWFSNFLLLSAAPRCQHIDSLIKRANTLPNTSLHASHILNISRIILLIQARVEQWLRKIYKDPGKSFSGLRKFPQIMHYVTQQEIWVCSKRKFWAKEKINKEEERASWKLCSKFNQ
jgi:hypothetical protein